MEIAIILINDGADLNPARSNAGNPLHHAIALDRDPRILEALLAKGAEYQHAIAVELAKDPNLKNGARYLELLNAAMRKSATTR